MKYNNHYDGLVQCFPARPPFPIWYPSPSQTCAVLSYPSPTSELLLDPYGELHGAILPIHQFRTSARPMRELERCCPAGPPVLYFYLTYNRDFSSTLHPVYQVCAICLTGDPSHFSPFHLFLNVSVVQLSSLITSDYRTCSCCIYDRPVRVAGAAISRYITRWPAGPWPWPWRVSLEKWSPPTVSDGHKLLNTFCWHVKRGHFVFFHIRLRIYSLRITLI